MANTAATHFGGSVGGNVIINGGTIKLTTVLNGTVAGNVTLGRGVTFGANGGILDITNTVGGLTGGGTQVIGGLTVLGGGGTLPVTTTAGAATSIIKFNGGSFGLSDTSNAYAWTNGSNALRLSGLNGAGPLTIQLSNGAMLRSGNGSTNSQTIAMPTTIAGPAGGDPTSGPNGTLNPALSTSVGRISIDSAPVTNYQNGLFLQGAIITNAAGATRALDGNITLLGIASGNAAYVTFNGRGTGTALGTTLNAPGGTAAGINALYIGQNGDDTLTIQDGAIANIDLRTRIDLAAQHPVVIDAKTLINSGGTLRFSQSYSNLNLPAAIAGSATAAANVGYAIVRNSITGQGTTAKDSTVEIYLPPGVNTFTSTNGVDFTGSLPLAGNGTGTTSLVVNGTGLGGLLVKGLPRPSALLGGADPVGADIKIANLLTPARLAGVTGTGGYLTPAATGATYTVVTGSEWAAAVPVGLKVIDSNASGTDVALAPGNWGHNIHVAAGATLGATAVTLTGGSLGGFGTVQTGTGAGNGLTFATGSSLSPGASPGLLSVVGDVNLNTGSTFVVEIAGTTAGTQYDQLGATGGGVNLDADAGAGAILSIASFNMATDPVTGQQFKIIDNAETDAVVGTFAGLAEGSTIPVVNTGTGHSLTLKVSYVGGDNNDVVLTNVVPEPTSLALAGLAAAGLMTRRRRTANRRSR